MVRLVTIVTPKNHSFEVLNVLLPLDNQQLYQLTSIYTNDNVQITFKTKDDELLKVLEKLNDTECGINWGHIDVVELLLSRPALPNADDTNKENNRKSLKIRERMTIDEIASLINDGNQLSFNFVALLALASIIAGTGLLMNSATTVIASMLVSPLMGPILSITFGLAVQGKESIQSGFKNVSIGIIICLVTGILMGLVASFIYSSNYRSDEMFSRGERKYFLF